MGCIAATKTPATDDDAPPYNNPPASLPKDRLECQRVDSSSAYEPPVTSTSIKDRTAPTVTNTPPNAATDTKTENPEPKDPIPPLDTKPDTEPQTANDATTEAADKPQSRSAAMNLLQMLNATAPQPQQQVPTAQQLFIHQQQQALATMRAKSAPAPPIQPPLTTSYSDGNQRTAGYNNPSQQPYIQGPHQPQLTNSNSTEQAHTQGPQRPQLMTSNSTDQPQRPLTPTRYAQQQYAQQKAMQVPYAQPNRPHSARNLTRNLNQNQAPVMQRHMFRSAQDMNAAAQAPTNLQQHALMQMRVMGSSPNLTHSTMQAGNANTNTNNDPQMNNPQRNNPQMTNPQHALMQMRAMGSSPNLSRSNAPNTQNNMMDRQHALMRMRAMGSSPNLTRSNVNNMQQTNDAPPMMNRAMFYSVRNVHQPQQNNMYQQQQAQYAQQQYWAAQQQAAQQQKQQQQGFRIVVSNPEQESEDGSTGSEEESGSGSEESGSQSESQSESGDDDEESFSTDEDYANTQLSPRSLDDAGDYGHNRMRTDMTTFGDSDDSEEEEQ